MCAFILLYVLPFKSDFKFWDSSAIETARLLFCRPYLEVHNQAPNMASRAKLGKYPMGIDINKKILNYVPVNSKTAHPSPAQNQGHLTFLENFGQIPHYVACLDGQMPHPLGLQRGPNPPPSRQVILKQLWLFSMRKTVYSNVPIL